MILELKQKHINLGVRGDGCQCAAAKALKEALDIPLNEDVSGYEWVEVDQFDMRVYCKGELVRKYTVPKKLAKFIATFDVKGKKAVKPGKFTIKRLDTGVDF
jgi:hypothetical protein